MATDQATTSMEPPNYDASAIKRIRPPEVGGENGQWHALWQLRTARPVTRAELRRAEAEISAASGIEARLTLIADSTVRLETIAELHHLRWKRGQSPIQCWWLSIIFSALLRSMTAHASGGGRSAGISPVDSTWVACYD